MQNNEVKSKRSILVAVALMLLIAASVVVLGKMSAAQRGSSEAVPANMSCSYNFDKSQNIGTTKYFSINCTISGDSDPVRVYLKVVKTGSTSGEDNNLTVYEADTWDAVREADATVSDSLAGSWMNENDGEIWTIIASGSGRYTGIDDLEQVDFNQSVNVLKSSHLPAGTTKLFSVCCKVATDDPNNNVVVTKYLKVVKTGDSINNNHLAVYEANSLAGAASAEAVSPTLDGLWTNESGQEIWTVSLISNDDYSEVFSPNLSVSVLQSWKNDLESGLPENTANYYRISCKNESYEVVTKYLMVKKSVGVLSVFEGDSLDSCANTVSGNFTAVWYNQSSENMSDYEETWYIALTPDNYDSVNSYRKILTVSPLDTTINASKIWAGKDDAGYVDVAEDTVVKFALYKDGAEEQVFYVKKCKEETGAPYLMISSDGQGNSYARQMVYDNSKTISAMLIEADNFNTAEEWRITITGYSREDDSGRLIEYTVKELDVDSSQPWIRSDDTLMRHTFDGDEIQNGIVQYTLVLSGNVLESENSSETLHEFDILRISKQILYDGKVSAITVEGLQGKLDTDSSDLNMFAFATVTKAKLGNAVMDPNDGKLTFQDNGNQVIGISDIQSSEHGVDLEFNVGRNNGTVTLNIQLTESGKLSYNFKGLPADIYTVDPDGREIAVDSYRVVTTMGELN